MNQNYHPILITAGATRNFIDSMRCITANASGKTGAWLAYQLPNTTLIGSPSAKLHLKLFSQNQETPSNFIEFSSTTDLHDKMKIWVLQNPQSIIIHSAAVGDYQAAPQNNKIPSGQKELTIALQPTIKILDRIKQWSSQTCVVSFKAAGPNTTPQQLTKIAQAQLHRSSSSLVFANILTQTHREVQLVHRDQVQHFSSRDNALNELLEWTRQKQEILED